MSSSLKDNRMTFKAYWGRDFKDPKKEVEVYTVMFNPESFDRTLSFKLSDDKTTNSGGTKSYAGVEAETYSFDLIFDGTGVAGPAYPGAKLMEEFRKFLKAVYCTPNEETKKKEISYVEITYCKEVFQVQLDSMTVKYLLFDSAGNPQRIKASCKFSTVEEPKPEKKKHHHSHKPKPAAEEEKTVTSETPTNQCCYPCPTYPQTVETAKQNQAASLMSCQYPMSSSSASGYGY